MNRLTDWQTVLYRYQHSSFQIKWMLLLVVRRPRQSMRFSLFNCRGASDSFHLVRLCIFHHFSDFLSELKSNLVESKNLLLTCLCVDLLSAARKSKSIVLFFRPFVYKINVASILIDQQFKQSAWILLRRTEGMFPLHLLVSIRFIVYFFSSMMTRAEKTPNVWHWNWFFCENVHQRDKLMRCCGPATIMTRNNESEFELGTVRVWGLSGDLVEALSVKMLPGAHFNNQHISFTPASRSIIGHL